MKPKVTGKLPLDPRAWLAIMSLSLIVNLPGLAVTPMLGTLSHIFPHTSQLEKQLLTMLPNLLIIPFVLMSGKLSDTPRKKQLIMLALLIVAGSTVGYMLSRTMAALIVFSCTLGIGAGLLVPFSTGLLSDTFSGKYLMRQMGLQSAVSNLTLVVATFVVGWLSLFNWHMPFLVYGVCLIPLALLPYLNKIPASEMDPRQADKAAANAADTDPELVCHADGIDYKRLVGLFMVYFLLTFGTISLSEYTPFLVATRHLPASITGTITSLFFLMVFLCGFSLTHIVRWLKGKTIMVASVVILVGMVLFTVFSSVWTMCAGVLIVGAGYGILQPLLYNKATRTVCRPSKSTQALAITLIANYSAIVVEPLVVVGLAKLCGQSVNGVFPFVISIIMCVLLVMLAYGARKSFVGSVSKSYYE